MPQKHNARLLSIYEAYLIEEMRSEKQCKNGIGVQTINTHTPEMEFSESVSRYYLSARCIFSNVRNSAERPFQDPLSVLL